MAIQLRPIRRAFVATALTAVQLLASSQQAPQGPLTQQGQKLAARYAKQLTKLRAELERALPKVSSNQRKAFVGACAAEKAAVAAVTAAQQEQGKVGTARALVAHAKGKWIGGADRGIKKAEQQLAKATGEQQRQVARQELAKWQANRVEGVKALNERQAALDLALREQPKKDKAAKAAQAKLLRAKAAVAKALTRLNLKSKLASSKLDGRLARFLVLKESTPIGLAGFAQQSSARQQLVDRLLADKGLMLQMVVADGARGGAYGRAMELYDEILSISDKAKSGPLQRLAVAIAIEHAVPHKQRNAADAPGSVDPVARYQHYEAAYLAKELDPSFGGLSVWDYRMVVDGEEPDEVLSWGREMLRSYRPDHVYTKDSRWRYVAAVRTDIRYGSQDNKHDRSDLQFFQNILMNGGVCGRRAFFGRFILRAFGVPTTARPQRGHAALAHHTPEGWVVCLGGGWGTGWTKTRYDRDLDFLAATQARQDRAKYMQVKRAQWLGDVVGEKPVYGLQRGKPGFWYGVSLYHQRQIIEKSKAKTLAPVGAELGESEDARNRYRAEVGSVTDEDRLVMISQDGVITIPAVSCSKQTKRGGKVLFLPSNLGGKQLHYSRNGGSKDLEYTFDVAAAGAYRLTARVASPSWQQHLHVFANGKRDWQDLVLPNTVGLWGETQPVVVELVAGKNVLRLQHKSEGYAKGFSIKDLTLTPMR